MSLLGKRYLKMTGSQLEHNIQIAEVRLQDLINRAYTVGIKEYLANIDLIFGELKGYTQEQVDEIRQESGIFESPNFISIVSWTCYAEQHASIMRERLLSKQWVDRHALLSSYKYDRFIDNIHAKHLNWLIHNREFTSNGSKYYLTNNPKPFKN